MNLARRLESLEPRPFRGVAAPPPLPLESPADVVAVIAEQVNAVRADGLADPSEKARTLGMLAAVMLRAMEAKDLDARVAAVERVLKLRKDADREKQKKGGR